MNMNLQHVFVYGTLRKGEKNDHLLKDAVLLNQDAWTYGKLFTTDNYYPVLVASNTSKVSGEIYEVTQQQMILLDKLEGYIGLHHDDNLYNRFKRSVYTTSEEIDAWVYFIHPRNEMMKREAILHGDWLKHKKNLKK